MVHSIETEWTVYIADGVGMVPLLLELESFECGFGVGLACGSVTMR